jgi:hypothetical protein
MTAFSKPTFLVAAFVALANVAAGAYVVPRANAPFRIFLGINTTNTDRVAINGNSTSCEGAVLVALGTTDTDENDSGYCTDQPFTLDGATGLTVEGCTSPDNGTFIFQDGEQVSRCGDYDGPTLALEDNCMIEWEFTCSEGFDD